MRNFAFRRIAGVSPLEEAFVKKFDLSGNAVLDILADRFNAVQASLGDMSFSVYALPELKYLYFRGGLSFARNLKIKCN